MADLKNTPLREFHQEMGAKMVPRSGWNLPLHFSEGATDEHEYCRDKAALFDFCADGRYRLAFPGAAKVLAEKSSAAFAALTPGKCSRIWLCDSEGTLLAPCHAGMMAEDDFFITVPFSCTARVEEFFNKAKVEYGDLSEYLCTIAIAGPRSAEVVKGCVAEGETLPGEGEIKLLELDGLRAIVSYFDDFGEEGFELSFNAECADQIWDLFLDSDIPWPAGLAAQESLRIENALEGAPEILIQRKEEDLARFGRVLFRGKRIPFAGVKLFNAAKEELGVVTSSAYCPCLESAAALVYFPNGIPDEGTELFCDASGVTLTGILE